MSGNPGQYIVITTTMFRQLSAKPIQRPLVVQAYHAVNECPAAWHQRKFTGLHRNVRFADFWISADNGQFSNVFQVVKSALRCQLFWIRNAGVVTASSRLTTEAAAFLFVDHCQDRSDTRSTILALHEWDKNALNIQPDRKHFGLYWGSVSR